MALDLITLAEYKTYVGISSTNQDATVKQLIPQVSALVKNICRRTFLDYVNDFKIETFRGAAHANRMQLTETPIMQVNTVEFSEDFGKTYTTLTEYDHYVVVPEDDAVELIASQYIDYFKTNAFRITYNAGYDAIPGDLKLAVADLIQYYVRNDSAIHSQKAVGANTVQIEYITTTNLPAHIKRVLDQYTAFYG